MVNQYQGGGGVTYKGATSYWLPDYYLLRKVLDPLLCQMALVRRCESPSRALSRR